MRRSDKHCDKPNLGRRKVAVLTATVLLLTVRLLEHSSPLLKPSAFVARASASLFRAPSLQNDPTLNDTKLFALITNESRFCFIHVGKAAGSKVSCELGLELAELQCPDKSDKDSAMRRAFIGRTHMYGARRQCEKNYPFHAFVYTLRNPVERLVSWYYYEHPQGANFYQRKCGPNVQKLHNYTGNSEGCFRTLEEFSINTVNHTNATKCQKLAYSVASGQTYCGCSSHNALGYDWYNRKMQTMMKNMTTSTKSINNMAMLAIRTEHVVQDWDQLERAFGGNNNTTSSSASRYQTKSGNARQHTNASTTRDVLSKRARLNLCNALCHEIQVYKTLLYAAQNLNAYQVQESLTELIATCPEETSKIRDCTNE